MIQRVITLLVLNALLSLSACGSRSDSPAAPAVGEPATVRFVELETGCWVLETRSGRIQPVDLPEAFRVDGLAVEVVLRDAPAMMSACQTGPLKTVERIARR